MVVLAAVCLGHDIAVGIQTVFSARQRNCGWCLDRAVQGEEACAALIIEKNTVVTSAKV